MLKEYRERQKKLLPLFAPELRPMRMAFLKGVGEQFIIYTVVFWISICFLFGSGYDTLRHMHDAKVIFRDFDQSKASMALGAMLGHTVETQPNMFTLVNETSNADKYPTYASVAHHVWKGNAWGAIVINKGFGANLTNALINNAPYTPTSAVTFVSEESRHYLKVQVFSKTVETVLAGIQGPFAQAVFKTIAAADGANYTQVIDRANPTALVLPYSYSVDNVAPYHFDTSLYILSVALSLGMVVGAFIPSNMWKSIEEPFFKQVKIPQVIALRGFVNLAWGFIICLQETGIIFAFRGPSWSPTVGDFFGIFGIILLNTYAFSFFIDCLQNWLHPKFLLATYFTTLFVNISGAIYGTELNNHFFRILYATPFLNSGFMFRTLLTGGSYAEARFAITVNVCWVVLWWVLSTYLIARKARLVRSGKWIMANIPPPPQAPAPAPAAPVAEKPAEPADQAPQQQAVPVQRRSRSAASRTSDIEVEDM
ncbi:hypothetical protein GGI12_004934 [Dipsacomyces acuminosporus]|nr:hypothetical protein GGI12_004934 [Dipsacomyces acuminosporus]